MTAAPQLLVHEGTERMARETAARLLTAVADAQATRGTASVVLTGGRNGNAVLSALGAAPGRDTVDWRRVDLWWGDERYLPAGDPDRNDTQARAAVLDQLPLDPARVHPMPAPPSNDVEASGGPEAAAERYAAELAAASGPFDVLLLGVGPDAHVASLFPGHPAAAETGRTVVAVREAPKPPPVRISLTMPVIRTAREVWLLAAGKDKADAVALALSGTDEARAPAAGARGSERTLWLLDEAAAAGLPPGSRPA